jgi:hypothetical protein
MNLPFGAEHMDEILLLTVQSTGQAGDDLLVFPTLSANEYSLSAIDKIKVVTPDNLVIEKDAEFAIPFDTSSPVYLLLMPNTQKDEIPVGSQIWVRKSLEEITRHNE